MATPQTLETGLGSSMKPQGRIGTPSQFFSKYVDPSQLEGLTGHQITDLIAERPELFGASNDDYKFYSKGVLEGGRVGTIFDAQPEFKNEGYWSRKGAYRGDAQGNLPIYSRQFSPSFTSRPYTCLLYTSPSPRDS